MTNVDNCPSYAPSDSIADHVQSFPKKEICLFSSSNVFLHIPAQYSATKDEIQVQGTLTLAYKDQIRVQWSPTKISSGDLLCLYSHDPSDDWEDLITDLNATDFPNPNGNGDTHEMNNNIPGNQSDSFVKQPLTPHRVSAKEIDIPAANGDPTMSIRVKTETIKANSRSPKGNRLSPGFVNIMTTPLREREGENSCSEYPTSYPQTIISNNRSKTETTPKNKSSHIFYLNQQHTTQQDTTMDNAIAKLGEYTDIGTDAVFLEREHAKIPEIKSIIVDFPLTMLFSVKEVQCKSNGARKSHPAIRFHLKGSKPTQNLYFHSGKSTMLRFYEELEKHILLHRHDEDPTLLMTEGEDFVGNYKHRNSEPKTYIQMGVSKASDFVTEISNNPKFKYLMNPFQKTTPVANHSPNKVPVPNSKHEEVMANNNLTEVTKSIPFLEKPDFNPMPLLHAIVGRKRAQPLNREDWELFCNRDGSITDATTIRRIIFNGGITPELRPLVWQYLLGYYKFSHSNDEREKLIYDKENEYQVMRSQWKTMSPIQIKKNKQFHKARTIIAKDVIRTDRDHPYFHGECNEHLDRLQDILLTHIMFDFDLGYIQGMSDILSPILIVLDREENAFWCFSQYLERLRDNFANTTQILNTKMNKFKDLLKFIDPPFCAYLRDNEAYGFNIFFRWLLVDFKREFSIDDVCKLWEVLWTDYLTPDYNLFIALSMLLQMRQNIMAQDIGEAEFSPFDNIFKMINDAAGAFNIDTTLLLAEALFNKMYNCPYLPEEIIQFFPNYKAQKLTQDNFPVDIDLEHNLDPNLDVAEYHFA